ncbi:hypothetical protein L2E82_14235 [Cichorium intybus]|uniref:Uncharacterized protein n=1 Tax=Cichorium intybus TaxID=13427 RepID=A0ACB9EZW0_CICIN|nr:hypothetical protein L2E82_14235 [Cichorium intybus]
MRKAIPLPARHGGIGVMTVKVKRVEKDTVEFDEEQRKRMGERVENSANRFFVGAGWVDEEDEVKVKMKGRRRK